MKFSGSNGHKNNYGNSAVPNGGSGTGSTVLKGDIQSANGSARPQTSGDARRTHHIGASGSSAPNQNNSQNYRQSKDMKLLKRIVYESMN